VEDVQNYLQIAWLQTFKPMPAYNVIQDLYPILKDYATLSLILQPQSLQLPPHSVGTITIIIKALQIQAVAVMLVEL
jgi:hypothetical protein